MFKDTHHNYNWTGLSESDLRLEMYTLLIEVQSETAILMKFIKFFTPSSENAITYKSVLTSFTVTSSDVSGWHEIDITRNNEGEFSFYVDQEFQKQITDNEYQTTEYFAWVSWLGNSSIDNLEFNDDPDAGNPENGNDDEAPFGYYTELIALGMLVIFQRSRRNSSIKKSDF